MSDEDFNELPHARGPEKSILSTMLKQPETYLGRAKADGLTAEHFHGGGHAALFRRIMEAGPELELVSFIEELNRLGRLEEIGGPAAVSDVYTYAPNAQHWNQHVQMLRDYLGRRRLIEDAERMRGAALGADPDEITGMLRAASERAAEALGARATVTEGKDAVRALLEQMAAFAASDGEFPGQPTGMREIDLVTGGMRPGDLWVIAGETSAGKSVGMIQAAAEFLREGKRVLVISLEMQTWQVMARLASCAYNVDMAAFFDPKRANHGDLVKAKTALSQMSAWPIGIDDRGARTFEEISGIAESYRDQHGGLDMLVVDYVQLIEGRRSHRNDTRESEVSAASKGLKALAKRLGCPVFTASQLNDNGKLRESRAIGQDADIVLAITEDGIKGLKIRNAERGQLFPLVLIGKYQRFERREISA